MNIYIYHNSKTDKYHYLCLYLRLITRRRVALQRLVPPKLVLTAYSKSKAPWHPWHSGDVRINITGKVMLLHKIGTIHAKEQRLDYQPMALVQLYTIP